MMMLLAVSATLPADSAMLPAAGSGRQFPRGDARDFASCEISTRALSSSRFPHDAAHRGGPIGLKSAAPSAPRPHTQSAWGPGLRGKAARPAVKPSPRPDRYLVVDGIDDATANCAVASRQQSSWAGRRPGPGGSDDERSHGWRERGAVQRGFSQDAKILSGPGDGMSTRPRGRHRHGKGSSC
jgi:hypothetical protein